MRKPIRQHISDTLYLAYPVALGQLGHMFMHVVDSAFVGRINAESLAGITLTHSAIVLIMVFGFGLTNVITALVAIASGAEDKKEIGLLYREGFYVNLISSFLMMVAGYIAADYLYLLDQPPEVTALGSSYMKLISFSMIPMMLFQTFKTFQEGLADTIPPMVVAISANIINALVNWVFVFGNLGMPEMGLDGAGIATFLSRLYMFIAIAMFTYMHPRYRKYDLRLFPYKPHWPTVKKILRIGVPSGLQYFFEIGAFSLAAIMMGWISANAMAAHQIVINLAAMTYMVVIGVSAAASIRVGNAMGRKDRIEIRRAGFTAFGISMSFMFCTGIAFVVLRDELPLLFIDDPAVLAITAQIILVAAFFQVFDGMQSTGLGVLRGITDVRIPTVLTFTAYWLIGLPSSWLLAFEYDYGALGIWIGLALGLFAAAVLLLSRFQWKTYKTLPQGD